jgi:glycine cleavage system H protein
MTEEIKVGDYIIRTDRKYMKSHEWVKQIDDKTWSIGISDYAQKMLREISYVQFEEIDETFEQKNVILVVEALKASGDIYAPFKLKLVENNEALDDSPELINSSPYDDGWLAKFEALEFNDSMLISPEEYKKVVEQELEDL